MFSVQVHNNCMLIEQKMFEIYETQSKLVEVRLQEIFATFDRITQIETELVHFKQLLGRLYSDINQE